jgi:hypothetical protein
VVTRWALSKRSVLGFSASSHPMRQAETK